MIGPNSAETQIGFSTLACPELSAHEVVTLAVASGADLIEWRGGTAGHVSPAMSKQQRAALRRAVDQSGISSLAVTAYTNLIAEDEAVRNASIRDLEAHLELAADLGARFVRAFLGPKPDGAGENGLVNRAIDALSHAAVAVQELGVDIALEPHDDFTISGVPAKVLAGVRSRSVGAVWDIANAFGEGQSPEDGIRLLGPWIRYIQIKDGRWIGGEWQLTEVGAGTVPLREALGAFGRPLPPLSVEWERAHHPDLAEAGVALPRAFAIVRSWLRDKQ